MANVKVFLSFEFDKDGELEMARRLEKPVFQVVPKKRTYKRLTDLDSPIRWNWQRINAKVEELWTGSASR